MCAAVVRSIGHNGGDNAGRVQNVAPRYAALRGAKS